MRPAAPPSVPIVAALAALALAGPASAGDLQTSATDVSARYHPRISSVDGQTDADDARCTDTNRRVRIERARTGQVVARTTTERDSTFLFDDVRLRPGRYVVVAPEITIGTEDGTLTCLRGESPVFGVTARP